MYEIANWQRIRTSSAALHDLHPLVVHEPVMARWNRFPTHHAKCCDWPSVPWFGIWLALLQATWGSQNQILLLPSTAASLAPLVICLVPLPSLKHATFEDFVFNLSTTANFWEVSHEMLVFNLNTCKQWGCLARNVCFQVVSLHNFEAVLPEMQFLCGHQRLIELLFPLPVQIPPGTQHVWMPWML